MDVTGDTVVINDITAQANMPVIGILKQAIDSCFQGVRNGDPGPEIQKAEY